MPELFRKEAIDHATRRLAGEVVLASPLSLKLLTSFFVVVVALAVGFAAEATYARREVAPGWIVPQGGLIRVTARAGGIVEAIDVKEGARVAVGAPLAKLRLSTDVASGDVGQAMESDLSAEAVADRDQAQASLAKLKAQRSEMAARRAVLAAELSETQSRVGVLDARGRLADAQVARGEKLLARGFLAPQQLDQLRSTALTASQDVSQARAAVMELQRQMGDLTAEISAVPADIASIRAQEAQSEASVAQRRTNAESQAVFVATAPIGGKLLAVPVELGQAVPPGGAVAVITPADACLTAELYVPSRAAGFIKAGQEVRLMYQAFPYQTFGTGRGVVTNVSQTVLAPSEVAIPGVTLQEPVFRVRVRLDRSFVQAYGHATPLQPGMLLSADIVTDRRNLLQWLLDPLYAAGRRV